MELGLGRRRTLLISVVLCSSALTTAQSSTRTGAGSGRYEECCGRQEGALRQRHSQIVSRVHSHLDSKTLLDEISRSSLVHSTVPKWIESNSTGGDRSTTTNGRRIPPTPHGSRNTMLQGETEESPEKQKADERKALLALIAALSAMVLGVLYRMVHACLVFKREEDDGDIQTIATSSEMSE